MLSPLKASPNEMHDTSVCFSRLADHPALAISPQPQDRFLINRELRWARSVLSSVASYLPFQSAIRHQITVQIMNEPCLDNPDWLGYLKNENMFLFQPALQSASILSFTFCHEFGHWLQKNVLNSQNWEEYIALAHDLEFNPPEKASQIIELFCDNFAWFCTNPEFLLLRNSRAYEFFAKWIQGETDAD